jgi:hypothetical protein
VLNLLELSPPPLALEKEDRRYHVTTESHFP